ncbi:hypothetical protein JKJ07_18160 [Actinoplanes sp. LDG1-01]|uniref:Calcineurin-like phosphoesterase domain-containing protein n=2 Tax=Paractinoplanes lichenicola TaxID=2802976 RepID=A0ABS1VNC4_9ACTN|nr:hypothetical protein [Actinoplanes lichenicola]
MRLRADRPQRLATISYRAAAPGGGTEGARLAVERFRVDALPGGYDAIVAAGDLQGIAVSPLGGRPGLLGIAVADYLGVWADDGLLPPPDRVGVLLTGDLHSAPEADSRGASGPVGDMWLAFVAAGCPMVFGVAGSHDEVTTEQVGALGRDIALLKPRAPGLALCGHVSWSEPAARLGGGHVVNVDSRVAVFTAGPG